MKVIMFRMECSAVSCSRLISSIADNRHGRRSVQITVGKIEMALSKIAHGRVQQEYHHRPLPLVVKNVWERFSQVLRHQDLTSRQSKGAMAITMSSSQHSSSFFILHVYTSDLKSGGVEGPVQKRRWKCENQVQCFRGTQMRLWAGPSSHEDQRALRLQLLSSTVYDSAGK
jgi:hypothetical protein